MRLPILILVALAGFAFLGAAQTSTPPNTLTPQEQADGWHLLWDGKTSAGWRSVKTNTFPAKGWVMKDGMLTVIESGGVEGGDGGDIITVDRYSDFELLVDFKLTPGANSGIKYFVHPDLDPVTGTGTKAATGSAIGPEYQELDDERHPDAKLGRNGDRTLASLYDLMPAAKSKPTNAIGEWADGHILLQEHGNRVSFRSLKIRTSPQGQPAK